MSDVSGTCLWQIKTEFINKGWEILLRFASTSFAHAGSQAHCKEQLGINQAVLQRPKMSSSGQ